MTKKKLSEAEKVDNAHKAIWEEFSNVGAKYSTAIFAVLFGLIEFIRKLNLYNAGVPLFVLDSEPLITSYTYGKTILLAIIYIPSLWMFIIGMEHAMLYKTWWKKGLSGILCAIGGIILLASLYTLLSFNISSKETIYVTKDYNIHSTTGSIQVKSSGDTYNCTRPSLFEDKCIKVNGW